MKPAMSLDATRFTPQEPENVVPMFDPPPVATQGIHVAGEPAAISASERILASMMEYGPAGPLDIPPKTFPTRELSEAAHIIRQAFEAGARGYAEVVSWAMDAAIPNFPSLLPSLVTISENLVVRPELLEEAATRVAAHHRLRQGQFLAWRMHDALSQGKSCAGILKEIEELESGRVPKIRSMVVRGILSYPTTIPPETVVLGDGWLRRGDICTFISTAGAGKSVASIQMAIAWGLGLPFFGIHPPRPLRILMFSGEDDAVTIGQCREGFINNSKEITGKFVNHGDLKTLDGMLRVEFSREHVGEKFHDHLNSLLTESPADLIIVNPLLSYIGGEIVGEISNWMRAGIMPMIQRHDCAAIFPHHTPKMSADGWDNTDDVYSGIGGGEIANIPRTILTLKPTPAEGLMVVTVSKRKTTGWKDDEGFFTDKYFLRRTLDPQRPGWLPVSRSEALEEINGEPPKPRDATRKVKDHHVTDPLKGGAMNQKCLLEEIRHAASCSETTAAGALKDLCLARTIILFTEPNPNGGKPVNWFKLATDPTDYTPKTPTSSNP